MPTTDSKRTSKSTDEVWTRDAPPLDLVGCCFAIWGEGGRIESQGVIRSRPEPGLYLVQFFDWIMGEPTTLTIMPIEKMLRAPYQEPGSMTLFKDDEHLRFWMQHRHREPDR